MNSLHAEKWGPLGAIFAAACCLGLTWLVSLVAALGAGFLIRDSILLPLLIVFLALSVWGLGRTFRRHGRPYAFWTGLVGAVALIGGMFAALPLAYIGIVLLVAAPLLDLLFQTRREHGP